MRGCRTFNGNIRPNGRGTRPSRARNCLRPGGAPSIVARVLPIDADHAQRAMAVSYQAVTADLERLDEEDLARPSRCLGWTRADLLYHMLLDAQRALVAFATPATGMTDVDFVSYWAPFRPGAEGYDAHARFVRRASSAYRSDLVIVTQWSETAAAAASAAKALPADVKVATQGGVTLSNGARVMPDPILVGRNEHKLRQLADAHKIERWSTDLEHCLANPADTVYFDAQVTARRAESVRAAIHADYAHTFGFEARVDDAIAGAGGPGYPALVQGLQVEIAAQRLLIKLHSLAGAALKVDIWA